MEHWTFVRLMTTFKSPANHLGLHKYFRRVHASRFTRQTFVRTKRGRWSRTATEQLHVYDCAALQCQNTFKWMWVAQPQHLKSWEIITTTIITTTTTLRLQRYGNIAFRDSSMSDECTLLVHQRGWAFTDVGRRLPHLLSSV